MKRNWIAILAMLICSAAVGQSKPADGYLNLTDTLVKQELSALEKLTEIPMRSGDSSMVYFSRGSTYIHLYFKQGVAAGGNDSDLQLDSIFFVSHSHYWVEFPRESYEGIRDLIPCAAGKPQKRHTYSNPYYKAYQSADKRRIYITLIGGKPTAKYRVVWVVKDSRYLGRTIDPVTVP